MKYLYVYEQFDDLSEEDIFGTYENKGPYDDILRYGIDGPKFKCGDRVVAYNTVGHIMFSNYVGTIVSYSLNQNKNYLICFDNLKFGYEGNPPIYNIPKGHGFYISEWHIKPL